MKYPIVVLSLIATRGAQQTSPADSEAEQPTAEISGVE